MFLVLFEVEPKQEHWNEYLAIAKLLRPELEQIEGFIDNQRFASERTEGRLLSLSSWLDEKALIRWRTNAVHHASGQARGRAEIFGDYRLRVAEVIADSSRPLDEPVRGDRFDLTEVGEAKAVAVVECAQGEGAHALRAAPGVLDSEWYTNIANPVHRLLLFSCRAEADAAAAVAAAAPHAPARTRTARVIREYGMRNRREAPQYFPDVP